MHPAYSVIIFTTLSGMGYGLLFWLAAAGLSGSIAMDGVFGSIAFGAALLMITLGLLSSTLHLGRPERAWRAFSQWRTSWLSREGVAAVVTYIPAMLLAVGWGVFEDVSGIYAVAAGLTMLGAGVTVWCTGMIYACLTTVKAWHHPLVAPIYCILALLTGAVVLNGLITFWFNVEKNIIWLGLAVICVAWLMKAVYWEQIDSAPHTHTAGDATGLARFGQVRVLEEPHTQANFVMREMGYQIARKHAEKLRLLATIGLFVIPALCLLALLVATPGFAVVLGFISVFSASLGVLVERWLFFAEAQHIVMLYYGAQSN
ncbi:MAG: DmsC/YnfH family molybdoenzyme membrane anchor subunit [Pseudomonadota bacterium]